MATMQYGINIMAISDEQVNLWKSYISEERRKRAEKYYFWIDTKRCILAEILIRYALRKRFGVVTSYIEFDVLQYGKPVVKDHEEWCFNLSHSGNWVVCAVDNHPVGIDVEEMNVLLTDIAEHYFTKNENDRIRVLSCEQDRVKEFFKLWTLKESYLKRNGHGLRRGLDSFEFNCIEGREIVFDDLDKRHECNFFSFFLDEKHVVSLCCESAEVENMLVLNGDILDEDIKGW